MNNIDIKIDELFDLVENTNYYKDYVLLKEKVKSNKHIMEIIKEIKRLQKIEVNTHDKEVKEKINELSKELNLIPLYTKYIEKKDMLYEELFIIKSMFESYFKDILKLV